ncbi:hypothetical protein ACFW04_014224 [Cataglyphis niger]
MLFLPYLSLEELGLPPRLCEFVYNLIHFRKLQFVITGSSLMSTFLTKVFLRIILSPILFNIYVAKLHKHIEEECDFVQFADDIAIFVSSNKIKKALLALEKSANQAFRFLSRKGLTISPSKSSLVIFTKKHIHSSAYFIKLGSFTIQSISSGKFLGVHLNFRLFGKDHIQALSTRNSKLLNILSVLKGTWWGGPSSSFLNIYKFLIRGFIEYGCIVFPFYNYILMDILEKIQYRAIRLCLGLRRITSTNVLLAEAGEGPLRFRFYLFSSKYILKIFSLDSHPFLDKLFSLLYSSFLPSIIFTSWDVERIKKAPIPQIIFFDIYNHLIFSCFSIYSPSLHLQFFFKTHSFSSIFTAEALAILHTLEYILTNSISKSVIFTDSKSLILSIIIFAIKQKLYEIKSAGFENSIVWIPAHSGILGNKTADYLAKKAISKCQIYYDPTIKFLKNQGNRKGVKYFSSFEITTLKPWFYKLKLNQESIVTICRLRSDHYTLNYSLHRCNLVADPSCSCGSPKQDADHTFWSCPHYKEQRKSLLSQLAKHKKTLSSGIQEILKNPSSYSRSLLLS